MLTSLLEKLTVRFGRDLARSESWSTDETGLTSAGGAVPARYDRKATAACPNDLPAMDRTITGLQNENNELRKELARERDQRLAGEKAIPLDRKIFQIMFNNTHDTIIQMDQRGYVVNANKPLTRLFGLTPEEIMGTDLSNYIFLGTDYRQAIELYKAASPAIPLPMFELEAFHRNGTRKYIEIQAKMLFNEGRIKEIITIVRDISHRKRLEDAKNATILGLAKLAESRDDNIGRHLERVREYVRIITQHISSLPGYAGYVSPDYVKDICLSSTLHDIGKVSIPDAVLLKPGPLTTEEFEVIKQHTIVGGNALRAMDARLQEQSFLKLGKEIASYHHESWDGGGYPEGLQGEAIPLSARIVALADVYDALTTKRVYKEAYPHTRAVDIIIEGRGKKFAPDIVDAFIANQDEFDRIRKKINRSSVSPDDTSFFGDPASSCAFSSSSFLQ